VWLTGSPVLAHNVVFLLALPLNGVFTFVLARTLDLSVPAAFLAGWAFAFAPYHSAQLSHLQMLAAFGMPLVLAGLHRCVQQGDRRGLALIAAGWLITEFSNAYMLVFFPLLVLLWCAWFVRPREWRRLRAPIITLAVTTLPIIPLLVGYNHRHSAYGLVRSYEEIRNWGADLLAFGAVSHREMLWRSWLPSAPLENALFPGFVIAVLVLAAAAVHFRKESPSSSYWPLLLFVSALICGVIGWQRAQPVQTGWLVPRRPLLFPPGVLFTLSAIFLVLSIALAKGWRLAWSRRDMAAFYIAGAVLLWILTLGPEPTVAGTRALAAAPYSLLLEIPGVQSIRAPARAWLPAILCLAVAVGFGTELAIARWPPHRRLIVTGLAFVMLAESWFHDRVVPVPGIVGIPDLPAGAVVLDLPIYQGYENAVPQYLAVLGGYRAVNGYSGYEPPHFQPFRRSIADQRVEALERFRALDDLYVIVRPGVEAAVIDWIATQPAAVPMSDTAAGRLYRLPSLRTGRAVQIPLPLPGPGHQPFVIPERD
jgi:hypothetical protein